MFVVCVEFSVLASDQAEFLTLVKAQAANSLQKEAECRRFDVCVGDGGDVFLYEIYSGEDAFQAHLSTSHFLDFDSKTKHMIENKTVRTYQLANKEV